MKNPVYDDKQQLIGHFIKDKYLKRVALEASDGNTYSVSNQELTRQDEHWVLAKPLSEFVKLNAFRKQQEHVDEMSDESFPASDPPDFTLGKNDPN
ncbi:hypothetical protein [Halomonas sp. KO116]|uniref:hypothetical protein n=1 Tax=Halomonas sp. KO116 TaxID=1504981 RepID=UPI0004E441E2|nr:hypothetical protein [Halomonas sp. KO116]AJY49472.1 hypothetical protein KO116_00975 [Halomonas sp. KO116]